MTTIINASTSAGLVQTADTSGILQLQTANTAALTIDASQNVTLTGALQSPTINTPTINKINTSTGYSLGAGNASIMKNRIINGAMVISQRNGTSSVTPASGDYIVDRFKYEASQASKFTAQQLSASPPVGFNNYLGFTVASAVSIGASDYFNFVQPIEGFNAADLGWGSANAKTVTLSCQVYSSLTGTFGGALQNNANNRSYPFTYSIPVANTWTTISVTIAGDTTGTWLTTNGTAIRVQFGLGVGSTFSGTAGSWAASNYISATGAVSVVGTGSATFYITGVQLEVGSSATGYEYVNYQTSLANCQRYYSKIGGVAYAAFASGVNNGATAANLYIKFPTTMRSGPTISYVGTVAYSYTNGAVANLTSVGSMYSCNDSSLWQPVASGGGLTNGYATTLISNNDATAYIIFSAEL